MIPWGRTLGGTSRLLETVCLQNHLKIQNCIDVVNCHLGLQNAFHNLIPFPHPASNMPGARTSRIRTLELLADEVADGAESLYVDPDGPVVLDLPHVASTLSLGSPRPLLAVWGP